MEDLYVAFKIVLTDEEVIGDLCHRRQAEAEIQVPRDMLKNIDPGNIFVGVMRSAIANFDNVEEEERDA